MSDLFVRLMSLTKVQMTKLEVFLALSIGIAYASRKSLQNVRSHGFPRFFGWEAILALLLLNFDHWFEDPLSLRQIVSWVLLSISIVYVIDGGYRLLRHGKVDPGRKSDSLYAFEKTSAIVSTGIYRYVRHPLYGSLILLCLGVFFKEPSWPGVALSVIAVVMLYFTAVIDERECLAFFGEGYRNYMQETKRFVPYLL